MPFPIARTVEQILFIFGIYDYIDPRSLLGEYEHSTSKEEPFKKVKKGVISSKTAGTTLVIFDYDT